MEVLLLLRILCFYLRLRFRALHSLFLLTEGVQHTSTVAQLELVSPFPHVELYPRTNWLRTTFVATVTIITTTIPGVSPSGSTVTITPTQFLPGKTQTIFVCNISHVYCPIGPRLNVILGCTTGNGCWKPDSYAYSETRRKLHRAGSV
jgi:hypothetical protein